ncbi:MAG TPA: low affinity iron permease family protein [Burkholderiales bacterium]|nr:low affinity iron permease family protein [Burkholderiales bacterium]
MASARQHTYPHHRARHADAAQKIQERFRLFAHRAAIVAGSPWAFATGVAFIALWAAVGHSFRYSEEWQLVVNTGTTIITFLMVFIIQNTQTRDSRELHVKLDELLRAVGEARTGVIRSDDLSDEELDRLHAELRAVASEPDGAVVSDPAVRQRRATLIVRHWLKRPPKHRTTAHLAEFYRALRKEHPELLGFEKGESARELARILRGHIAR